MLQNRVDRQDNIIKTAAASREKVTVLTPKSVIRAFAAGYVLQVGIAPGRRSVEAK